MNKRNDERNDPFGPFNFSEFKSWMKNQQDCNLNQNIIGLQVESKISFKKLITKIEVEDGELKEVAKEFIKSGGTIKEVNGQNFLIEVKKGIFLINRTHTKR